MLGHFVSQAGCPRAVGRSARGHAAHVRALLAPCLSSREACGRVHAGLCPQSVMIGSCSEVYVHEQLGAGTGAPPDHSR